MSNNITKDLADTVQLEGDETLEFVMDDIAPVSSSVTIKGEKAFRTVQQSNEDDALKPTAETYAETVLPIFKQLASPKLPELSKENRARLLIQSPNLIFFYWTIKNNPFQTLNRAFGNMQNYVLIAKLTNLRNDREEIHTIGSDEGSMWFSVNANAEYQVEIGFYASNRPYIRVMFSNKVETPRHNPSPNPASSSEWTVSANKFAQVLESAGFSQDAFDVALAGDDLTVSKNATEAAFTGYIGRPEINIDGLEPEEIRFAMLALASGVALEYLRLRISSTLFAILQEHSSKLNRENALAALQEQFVFDSDELVEENSAPAVFGASLINFPRVFKRRQNPKFNPVSSHNVVLR